MEHIEDLPENLQKIYDETWDVHPTMPQECYSEITAKLFFLAGYEAATKPQDSTFLKTENFMISVGRTYLTKAGNKIKILTDSATGKFNFIGETDGGSLRRLSWYGKDEHNNAYDAVSEVREPKKFETEIYCFSGLTVETVSTLIAHGHWYGHPNQLDKTREYTRFRVTFEEIIE